MRVILQSFFLLLLACACMACQASKNKNEQQPETVVAPAPTPQALTGAGLDSAEARKAIAAKADAVVQAIASQDFGKLARYVHPTRGLRFSPYANIDTSVHQVLAPEQVGALPNGPERLWGYADGSGKPIRMPFSEYYKQYIYNKPYAKADTIGYNRIVGGGNMIYNYRDIYPDAILVEYYLPGSEEKYAGMDWGSLILVFTPYEGEWYLTSLAHGQWTI